MMPSHVTKIFLQTMLLVAMFTASSFAFMPMPGNNHFFATRCSTTSLFGSTTVSPPDTETEKREKKDDSIIPPDQGDVRGPLEWLIDDPLVSREDEDPFHIILLDETFVKNERMTIEYAASSCVYVLQMPYDEAAELASHAKTEGFSCLGTWSHDECLKLGAQLQQRDLICRVVPFCQGGDRAWQARNAESGDDMKRAEDVGYD
mmetsp:Transcript_1076/g.1456  ORF Transcript_1076/g.1456 Transcript_1076/m.1456 type:complete len:204 (-) Transcript_1076:393-1004(-)|eukprot:CAMPEP_0201687046 /NCGR_PEP_ID=MMETSP0578-20130828/1267_1 /ASSEMBLY_ACC=CAM_ASM_000663 /TAXON_ID=267565 /ORGANISM="Skeletonema grethea, Strain CCMP 1804" /LENGTH=203 /DNA_ID=CAMNT_0048171165 /DNA_START=61 /DNA_END=672 /DNA_ORIENTATION=+